MARIYQARQLKDTKAWHMTCASDEEKWCYAIGYCGERNCQHETAKEAEECWKTYRLDNELTFSSDEHTQKKCEVCGEWTQGRAFLGREFPEMFSLCGDHLNRESVAKVLEKS